MNSAVIFNYVAVPILLAFGLVYFLIALVVVGIVLAFQGRVPKMYANFGQRDIAQNQSTTHWEKGE